MKIINVVQNTEDWLRARAGIPTASEFHNLVTPGGKVREGDTPATYMHRKLAEKWTGAPLPTTYSGGALEQGNLRQDEAIPWYVLTSGREIEPVGFITTDDGRIGCSPDGMFGDGTGIEVKCPDLHTQIKYLFGNELPPEYWPQVQGSMLVTGAPRWVFLSYCRALPPLVLTVERDEKAIAVLRDALDKWLDRFDDAYQELVHLNGGPPTPIPVSDEDDVLDII